MPIAPPLLAFIGFGFAILFVAWVPLWLERVPLTLPMLAVAVGYAAFAFTAGAADPRQHPQITALLTETVLIVAVMGAGLSIDRRFHWRYWATTWRLLGIAMPLSIIVLGVLGWSLLGLSVGTAIMLAGILAPTDPVLATEVQVGPAGIGEEGETRFALTSEAGLNDGIALPFVALGLVLITRSHHPGLWLGQWLAWHVLGKTIAGAVIGGALAWLLTRGSRLLPQRLRLSQSSEGVASIGLAFIAYGVAQALRSNGFVAVFAAAITLRNLGRSVQYARRMDASARRAEQLLALLVLGLFGGAIASGVLHGIGWKDVGFALLALLIVRPAVTLLSLLGSRHPLAVRAALGYFGIRGLGSLYYVAWIANQGAVEHSDRLWRVVALTVLMSVVLYGATSRLVMDRLNRHLGDIDRDQYRHLETADLRAARKRKEREEREQSADRDSE